MLQHENLSHTSFFPSKPDIHTTPLPGIHQPDTESPPPVPEPLPDWPVAKHTWERGWPLHVYGLGSFYVSCVILCLVLAARLRRRLFTRPLVGALVGLVCLVSSLKALVLFVDPYHSTHLLPSAFVHVTHGLTFPCVIAVETFLERILASLVRSRPPAGDIPSAAELQERNQSRRAFLLRAVCTRRDIQICAIVLYFIIVASIYITVAYRASAKHLLILAQMTFITWGFTSTFFVVYRCVALSRYSRQTRSALRQIIAYSKMKRRLERTGGDPTAMGLAGGKRLLPRIAKTMTGESAWTTEDVEDDVGDQSSSSDGSSAVAAGVFYNDAVYYSSCAEDELRLTSDAFRELTIPPRKSHRQSDEVMYCRNTTTGDAVGMRTTRGTFRNKCPTTTMDRGICYYRAGIGANYSDYDEYFNGSQEEQKVPQRKYGNSCVSNDEYRKYGCDNEDEMTLSTDVDPLRSSVSTTGNICRGEMLSNGMLGNDRKHQDVVNEDGFVDEALDDVTDRMGRLEDNEDVTAACSRRASHGNGQSRHKKKCKRSNLRRHVTETNMAFAVDSDLSLQRTDDIRERRIRVTSSSSSSTSSTEGVRYIDDGALRNGGSVLDQDHEIGGSNITGQCLFNSAAMSDTIINGVDREVEISSFEIGNNNSCGSCLRDVWCNAGARCTTASGEGCVSVGGGDVEGRGKEAGGYLADTELGSPKRRNQKTTRAGIKFKSSRKHSASSTVANKDGVDDDVTRDTCTLSDSPRKHPFPLPARNNGLGLHRIMQGCVIRSVLRVTYAHVMGSFVICMIQIYALFGVFGVLSNEKVALPWPWYTFQTFARLSEILFLFSVLAICRQIGCRLRSRAAIRRRLKLRHHRHDATEPSDVTQC